MLKVCSPSLRQESPLGTIVRNVDAVRVHFRTDASAALLHTGELGEPGERLPLEVCPKRETASKVLSKWLWGKMNGNILG